MNCPVCDDKLREVEKHGVTVDICPGCKGVWLDRGELDKIIDMVQGEGTSPAREPAPATPREARPYAGPPPPADTYRDDDDDDHHHRRDQPRGDGRYRDPRRRRGGMLGEIFEMFGD